jgi:hypothetical protein
MAPTALCVLACVRRVAGLREWRLPSAQSRLEFSYRRGTTLKISTSATTDNFRRSGSVARLMEIASLSTFSANQLRLAPEVRYLAAGEFCRATQSVTQPPKLPMMKDDRIGMASQIAP